MNTTNVSANDEWEIAARAAEESEQLILQAIEAGIEVRQNKNTAALKANSVGFFGRSKKAIEDEESIFIELNSAEKKQIHDMLEEKYTRLYERLKFSIPEQSVYMAGDYLENSLPRHVVVKFRELQQGVGYINSVHTMREIAGNGIYQPAIPLELSENINRLIYHIIRLQHDAANPDLI